MKKQQIIAFITVLLILIIPLCTSLKASALDVSASSAALMVLETGELIYEKNPYTQRPMASTTKIMTSLIALEANTPQREITVTEEMLKVEGTSMGLLAGDSVTLKTLVYGMLLQSGNDAANVTAVAVGGSVEDFIVMMNERAKKIGMKNTSFVTPSGLDAENHYSTAYDMALLGCEALKNPEFAAICSQKTAALYYGNPPYRRTLTNHNKLLWSYKDTVGIKTGFTKKSGRCLVSAAERNGVTLVAVTLNAPGDWSDHKAMFEYGFSVMENRVINCDLSALSLKVTGGESERAGIKLACEPSAVVCTDSTAEIRQELFIKRFEYAPLEEGKVVGEARYYIGDKMVCSVPIVTSESIELKKVVEKQNQEVSEKGFFKRIIEKIQSWF